MTEDDFDDKKDIILANMEELFKDRMTPRDIHTIDMFCTLFKDKFCTNEKE